MRVKVWDSQFSGSTLFILQVCSKVASVAHGPRMLVGERLFIMTDHPFDRCEMGDADAMGVGDADWAQEMTGIPHPVGSSHLSISVEGVNPSADKTLLGALAEG